MESELEKVAGNDLEIGRAILRRKPVDVCAHFLQQLKMVPVRDVLRALEHHVFEEVCKSRSLHLFIFRTDMVHDDSRGDGRRMIFVQDDGQAVLEPVLVKLDVDLRKGLVTHKHDDTDVRKKFHWDSDSSHELED